MKEQSIQYSSGTALEMVFQDLLDGDDYQPAIWRGAGICLFEPLPPEAIIAHYHPTILQDPLNQ